VDCLHKVAANGLRLSDVWIFRERSARIKDEQRYTDDNRFKRSSVFLQPGQKLNSDMKIGFPFFSPYIRKPNVEPTPTVKIPRIIVKITELPFSLNKSIMKKK